MDISLKERIISCIYFLFIYALMVWMLFLARFYLLTLPKWLVFVYWCFVSFGMTGFLFGTEKYVRKWFLKR